MKAYVLSLFALSLLPLAASAESTFLAEKTIPVNTTRSSAVLDRTLADLRMLFQKFQFVLDSSTKYVVPKKVSGTPSKPVVTATVQKCVALFICETIELDAEIQVQEVRGKCDRDFVITVNLARSSQKLRDIYDRLDVNACYKASGDGKGTLKLAGFAHHSPRYESGMVQRMLFDMLQMQVAPIVKAMQETLKAKDKEEMLAQRALP
jgi:hypothetical protein